MDERFKLCSQHDIHKDERQRECKQEVKSRLTHLLRLPDIACLVVCRQTQRLYVTIDSCGDRGRRSARFCVCEQCYLTLAIDAIDRAWPGTVFDLHHAVERYPAH